MKDINIKIKQVEAIKSFILLIVIDAYKTFYNVL